jgi:hypothetical protein
MTATAASTLWLAFSGSNIALRRIGPPPSRDPIALIPDDDFGWGDLEFVDALHGWAVDRATVYRTEDGGRHWASVNLSKLSVRHVDL